MTLAIVYLALKWTLDLGDTVADLQNHLVLGDLAVLDVATHLDHLEPGDLLFGATVGDGVVDGIGDAVRRDADEFDFLIDAVRHFPPPG